MIEALDADSRNILSFTPPNLALQLAIGCKRNAWYLIFARQYPTADSRIICRLDRPGTHNWSSRCERRFWFNPKSFTGWEPPGQSLLEYLLSLDPPILKVISSEQDFSNPIEIAILIPEQELAHWCERCHLWETVKESGDARWIMYRSKSHPGYLCPPCSRKDWLCPRIYRLVYHLLATSFSALFRNDSASVFSYASD
ncbi:hypothetical protein Moror_17857 [Moniliophthora roreri MCA 2997]|uniref:Uncharacterized protein n=1 Tax=Moniliophthora roreri (strain MCA 2997) TaxID=1381753 RepID=V2XU48_MONRO|nr:hypothetical protein Moror_17857 [Moniliophthora roreri MCA 2997]KAI3611927.1 hypothetical protein WG66_016135 [Moniliophthora roreri]